MTLDINPEWVTFNFFNHPNPADSTQMDPTQLYPQMLGAARLAQGAAAAAFSPAAGATVAALGGKKRTGRLFGGYGGG